MSTRNYNSKRPSTNLVVPITTRDGLFPGLSFKITKENDIQKTNYLSSVPNISFSFDYTRTIIDYAESKNENDKELIKSLFFQLKPGITFSLIQAEHLIEDPSSEADLSGTYSFVKLVNYAIIAEPVSIKSINPRFTVYRNKYIKSIPQIGLNTTIKNPLINYTITNSLISDKKISFSGFGLYPGDSIKITGTVYNNGVYKILSLIQNSDGTETLIVENPVKNEVSFGNIVGVELVQMGPSSLVNKDTSLDTGACVFTKSNGEVICYNDQTKTQCDIRAYDNNTTGNWTKNSTCTGSTNRNLRVNPRAIASTQTNINQASRISIITPSRDPTPTTTEIPSVAV